MWRLDVVVLCVVFAGLFGLFSGCVLTQAPDPRIDVIGERLGSLAAKIDENVKKGDISLSEGVKYWEEIRKIKADVESAKRETDQSWWVIALQVLGVAFGIRLRHVLPGLSPPGYVRKE